MKTIWRMFLELIGFPTPPRPEQIGERLVTMRQPRDCHNPMVATLCGVSYEQAHKALWHFNLPFFLESPLLSNPLNVKRGIRKLGFEPVEIGLSPLLDGEAKPGKVGVLVHDPANPIFAQHWVVWMGMQASAAGDELFHVLHWGQTQQLVYKTQRELIDLVTLGTPNCVFEVRKN
jgi:hypothetical protein